ncbi:MAG: DUF411 domain-containing protein [Pseudomonadota bacterium]|nr:DUF411 domain-containing protein [Pseudomonadota bacterium]|tara:strand:- start:49 stop:558 length:510 start_codon:yes stop_codon:yes gene_type:complete
MNQLVQENNIKFKLNIKFLVFLLTAVFFTGPTSMTLANEDNLTLTVHKTPFCGCCKKWIKHAREAGINVIEKDHQNLNAIKREYKINPKHQSCHTSISKDGYIFEGHIHADVIKKYLENPSENSKGLSVPGMPIGSPGMEMDGRLDDYVVLTMFEDNKDEIFLHSRDIQ